MDPYSYRYRLNLLAQHLRKTQKVEYIEPNAHAGNWTARVLVNGMVYGEGSATSKANAYEYGAKKAFTLLIAEHPECDNKF
ncbi:hypothetical protein CPC08DRAFT_709617 [Agrocybe pediades]|nr:hypothetical protein CPC08DRAFT_709617 [Agrocybe pediades]